MRAIILPAVMMMMMLASTGSFAAPADQGASTKLATLDPNERICKDIMVPGSRMIAHRFCATRAEWALREREDKDATKSMQRPLQTCNIMGTRRC